jgi:carboxymethylenebutenolidase
MGTMVRVVADDGIGFDAYLALPPKGEGPGIVVLPEMYNFNSAFREVADGYAADGFVALAPDMYWRAEPGLFLEFTDDNRPRARALYAGLDRSLAVSDVGRCIKWLRRRADVNGKVAIVGFCMGGEIGALAACRLPVDAVAVYYGTKMEPHVRELATIKATTIMHFAENDPHVPLLTVDAIREATRPLPHVSIHVYPGAAHAFARPRYAHFDAAATALARERTRAVCANLFHRRQPTSVDT